MNPNYQPARDDEAEWSVLSAVFAEPSLADKTGKDIFDPDNYWQPVGKSVAMAIRGGFPPDAVAIGQWVNDHLGNGAVTQFSEKVLCGTVSVGAFDFWKKRLLAAAKRRKVQAAAYKALLGVEDRDADADGVAAGMVEAIRNMAARETGLPPILPATEFEASQMDEPPELLAGVLHKGCKMVIGGTSKSMKTWTLLDLGLSMANGISWWNFKTAKCRVLFMNFEIKPHSFRKRIRAVCDAKKMPIPENFHVWNLRGHSADLRTLRPRLVERIGDGIYDVIIFDPIYKVYGDRDENSAGQMGELMVELDKIAVAMDVSTIFGHHFAKGNLSTRSAIDKMSGSGVFARDPDSILIMSPHKEDNVFVVDVVLRDFKPVDPFCVKWDYPLMRYAPEENPDQIKTEANQTKYTDEDVMKYLDSKGISFTELTKKVKADPGMSQPTLSKYVKRLVEAGRIERESTLTGCGDILKKKDVDF